MEANVEKAQAVCIPLSEATLSLVKAGMIWYEDDTVSTDLIPGKRVKSLVLAVNDGIVYGDLFVEEQKSKKQISEYVKFYQSEFVPQGTAYQLTSREMALLLSHIKEINAALIKMEKPIWQGAYLTATECGCYHHWVYEIPSGVLTSNYLMNARVRLVMRYSAL